MDGETYYRLRDAAYSANGTAAQFNVTWGAKNGIVITSGAAYNGYRPTGASKGEKSTMNAVLNGKAVSVPAVNAGNNWYVPASFLKEIGVTIQ